MGSLVQNNKHLRVDFICSLYRTELKRLSNYLQRYCDEHNCLATSSALGDPHERRSEPQLTACGCATSACVASAATSSARVPVDYLTFEELGQSAGVEQGFGGSLAIFFFPADLLGGHLITSDTGTAQQF